MNETKKLVTVYGKTLEEYYKEVESLRAELQTWKDRCAVLDESLERIIKCHTDNYKIRITKTVRAHRALRKAKEEK